MLNFNWLAGLSTTEVKIGLILLFALVGLWVALLPRDYVMEGSEAAPWWMDLRVWTISILAALSAIYAYF